MMYVAVGARYLLACVFLISFVGKVRGHARYAEYVTATGRLMPRPVLARVPARVVAPAVVVAEAAIVILLAVPATVLPGLVLSCLLLAVFAGATAAALRRGDHAPCHCFGSSQRAVGVGHVVRNVLLALVAVAGMVAAAADARPLDAAQTTVVAGAAVVAAVLFVIADDIADVFRTAA